MALMSSDSVDIKLTVECFRFPIYCLVITSTFLSWFGFVAALNNPTWCTFVVLNLELNSENVFFFCRCASTGKNTNLLQHVARGRPLVCGLPVVLPLASLRERLIPNSREHIYHKSGLPVAVVSVCHSDVMSPSIFNSFVYLSI